ncbi:hypothetical protein CEP53_002180 [Fusarium sp. AF-6]|nr:hypothetical protein CEP53_002180 [Fusarium sp. AF-6]
MNCGIMLEDGRERNELVAVEAQVRSAFGVLVHFMLLSEWRSCLRLVELLLLTPTTAPSEILRSHHGIS